MSEANDLLQKGIQAAKAKQLDEARKLLSQVVKLEPRNEVAWLWLSGVIQDNKLRVRCLENVLAINPDNAVAQKGLQALKQIEPNIIPLPEEKIEERPSTQPSNVVASKPKITVAKPQPQEVMIACIHCKQPMSIDASVCPNCGKSGGFSYVYMMRGGLIGGVIGILINFIWVLSTPSSQSDVGTDLILGMLCGGCILSPTFWIITVPGIILGVIIGLIYASSAKRRLKNTL